MAAKRAELIEEQPTAPDLYDKDFYQWTQVCARLIRERRLDCVDLPNIAEEIRDLGKRDKREVYSRLIVLIAHLLKLQIQPERRSQSWIRTIRTQRRELELVLTDSPSLRSRAQRKLPALYTRAVEEALGETGIAPNPLPDKLSWSR